MRITILSLLLLLSPVVTALAQEIKISRFEALSTLPDKGQALFRVPAGHPRP